MRPEGRVLSHTLNSQTQKVLVQQFAHELPHSKRMLCVCRSSSCTDCRDVPISSPAGRARVQSRRSGLKGMKQSVGFDQSLMPACFQVLCQLLVPQLLCMQLTIQEITDLCEVGWRDALGTLRGISVVLMSMSVNKRPALAIRERRSTLGCHS